MTGASTLKDVIDEFEARGWASEFGLGDTARVRCHQCGADGDPDEMDIAARRRVEGASDPADMSTVYAVTCPACHVTGTLILRYGPEASAAEADVAQRLRGRPDGAESADPPPPLPPEPEGTPS